MPPEPFPWDRKDLIRERKHDPVARWRDPSLSSYGGSRNSNDFSRWNFPSDFRRVAGRGKQGGWHPYPEDFPHGYPTSRYGDRFVEDEGFRPSVPRGDGRYGRVYRENRTTLGQREWRSHSWENNHHQSVPRNAPGRAHCMNELKSLHSANDKKSPHVVNTQKSPRAVNAQKTPHVVSVQKSPHVVNDLKSPLCVKDQNSDGDSPICASHPRSDLIEKLRSKEKAVQTSNVSGPGTGQKVDKEVALGGLEWNPVKWSRSGSLTSRCSGYSHSSSAKSIAGESNGVKGVLPSKKVTPVQSPSGDAVTCPPFINPSDETVSRKKPRLGWGMGLAKYEGRKGDGPEENDSKARNGTPSNVEQTHSFTSNLVQKSPTVAVLSDCSSPASPSSVACSSSQGLEDKAYGGTSIAYADLNNCDLAPVPDNRHEGSQLILEKLVLNSITDLSSLISELLQADEQFSPDSGYMRSSTLNKLLLWKDHISKSLEMTETEIDSLENELKSLSDYASNSPRLVSLNSLSADCRVEPHEDLNVIQIPSPLEVGSSEDMEVRETLPCETTTSKSTEPLAVQTQLAGDTWKQGSEEMGLVESTKWGMQNLLVDAEKMVRDDCVPSSSGNLCLCDKKLKSICDSILVYNKDSAARASEVLDKLLPSGNYCFSTEKANRGSTLPADPTVMENFLRTKRLVTFKERVLSLKYKAIHHLWKEDLRLLSLKNNRTKQQKQIDVSTRTTLYASMKHRSSVRSRSTSPAGSLSLVPTTEIVSSITKMLSESQLTAYRNSLKMPSMFLDEKERSVSRFLSNNGLVEDPRALEKERALINPWTNEEKKIFMDKLATLGKDFGKIASFIDHKTTADCVEFYYKNRKSECFAKTPKKQWKPVSASTYLMTSEKKLSRERDMSAASLDILGAASVIASQAEEAIEPSRAISRRSRNRKPRGLDMISEAFADDERDSAAADVLAGICGSISSEAMSSCITGSVDPAERNQDSKHGRVGSSSVRRPWTPDVTQKVYNDDDSYSDESCGEMDGPVDWTDDDKSLFVKAFTSYGNDFKIISKVVRTKSRDQCRVFFSKARKCLGLDIMPHGTSDVETVSVVCSDKSGSRMDEDLSHISQVVSKPEAIVSDMNILEDNCTAEKTKCNDDMHCEDLRRGEIHRITEDDPCKAETSIGGIDMETVANTNESSVSTLENYGDSFTVLVGPREGCYQKSTTDADDSKLSPAMNQIVKVGSNAKAQSFADTCLRKCHRKQSLHDAAITSLPLANNEGSEREQLPCRNGNLKLFGKILSTPENPTCSAQTNDHEANNPAGLENVPIRSGFWDGTKIQTGFSPMPNSALLLAKYPAAFDNYTISRPPSMAEENECNLKQKQDTFSERLQDGGGISDPVAALKLHYARTTQHEQYIGR